MNPVWINLSSFNDRFADDSRELEISKDVAFIFGKNGTGKTTITNTIKQQLGNSANVCIFDGFDGIVGEDHRLNAIALGNDNAILQGKINIITKEIENLTDEIEGSTTNKNSISSKLEKANADYNTKISEISEFYTRSARQIKNRKIDNVSISSPTYNKDSFISEIEKAKELSESEIASGLELLKSKEKKVYQKIQFPSIDCVELQKLTNAIIQSYVSQAEMITELENNADKQNFAKEGVRIHEHKPGTICAFCGNEISEKRWEQLGNYFNQEVKSFENQIDKSIEEIIKRRVVVTAFSEISKEDYLLKFSERIVKLNLEMTIRKSEYLKYFDELKRSLEEKKKNLFSPSLALDIVIPNDYSTIKNEYENIVDENNSLSDGLKQEQGRVINALRYHEILKALKEYNYDNQKTNLAVLKSLGAEVRKEYDGKMEIVNNKKYERNELIIQTQDESIIATKINGLLVNMGVSSFSLELIDNDEENQKGQYEIRGYNNVLRSIDDLSKGEKNIIAFLYFLFALEKNNSDSRQQIVVLDDPMTSNDDTMQYLMIGEIQRYYRHLPSNSILIVFTHNCHFYFNVRPDLSRKYQLNGEDVSFYEKYDNFHLYTNGKQTTIKKITKGKQDFNTNYELLWKELKFLFEANEPNLMLNACRKICETYMAFTKKSIDMFYGEDRNAKKLFDVNQHALNDLEAEQNGRTREEIRDILLKLFENNNAKEHFLSYISI